MSAGSDSDQDDPNERVGSYEVFRKIATGRIGDLFLAKQLGLDGFEKLVVLRRVHEDLAADPEFTAKLIEDARVVARLSHPNIVQLYDLGKDSTAYFLAIEYVPGRNLASIAAKMKAKKALVPIELVVKITSEVLAAIHFAHTREDDEGNRSPIVHRGVTPKNVIVAFSGTVKLADFGMTNAAARIARKMTGVFSGRYEYMSPEQVHGAPLDPRSDIFSAGCLLYEMLAGVNPFTRDDEVETLNAIATEDAPDVRLSNPAISRALGAVIMRALQKRKSKRWASAEEMQGALDDYLSACGKRSDMATIGKWVTELFADELLSKRAGSLAADAIVEHGGRALFSDEEGTAGLDLRGQKLPDGLPKERPTEIVPLDDTTIQPLGMFKAARVAAAALETEIAPFQELPTAALAAQMHDGEEVGFEVELSTLGAEDTINLSGELENEEETHGFLDGQFDAPFDGDDETSGVIDPAEQFGGEGAVSDAHARDPADPARSRVGGLVLETESPDDDAEVSFSWQDALKSLDLSEEELELERSARDRSPSLEASLDTEDSFEREGSLPDFDPGVATADIPPGLDAALPYRQLSTSMPSFDLEVPEIPSDAMPAPPREESDSGFKVHRKSFPKGPPAPVAPALIDEDALSSMEDASQDPHAISRAFEAFSIDDLPAPKRKIGEEPQPLELPEDALQPIPEPTNAKGGKPKRNIVEVHRPGPAAPTQFLSGDGSIVDAAEIAKLPEILRERSGQTMPPKIIDPPGKKK